MPDGRQLALLIWSLVALLVVLWKGDLRSSLFAMVRALIRMKVLAALTITVAWVVGEVVLGSRLSLWVPNMATSTVFWFFGAGTVLFVNAADAAEKEHFFRNRAATILAISVLLGVLMNLFVFSVWVELLLQPLAALMVMLRVLGETREEFRPARNLVNFVGKWALLWLAVYEVSSLVEHHRVLTNGYLVRQVLLPVWLALGLLPVVFSIGVWSEYELAFTRTEWNTGRKFGKRLALLTTFGPQVHELHTFIASSSFELLNVSTFADTRRVIRKIRETNLDTI